MISISLCMIVRDEEEVLARCLDSVSGLVEEIIIVDTGSRDRTREIAAQYTDKLYDFTWINDFSAARNYAFSKAAKDYILWLDADDVIPDPAAFRDMAEALPPETDTVMMRYETSFDKNGQATYWFYRERLVRREERALWLGAVHEVIAPFGVILYRDVAIRHCKLPAPYTRRNLEIYQAQLAKGVVLQPRDQFYYARELYYHGEYEEAINRLNAYLEGPGWVENRIEACMVLASCHEAQKNDCAALAALTASFAFDLPRSVVCCRIGALFARQAQWTLAVYWYKAALACGSQEQKGGFINADAEGYLPCIQLAYCYGKLNQPQLGRQYNEMAGTYKPDDGSYLHNKAYYDGILGE